MYRFVGTIALICFVLLSGWLLGCSTTPAPTAPLQEGVMDSEGEAVIKDADPLRKKIPRKRGPTIMRA